MLVLTSSVLVSWLAFLNPRLAFGSLGLGTSLCLVPSFLCLSRSVLWGANKKTFEFKVAGGVVTMLYPPLNPSSVLPQAYVQVAGLFLVDDDCRRRNLDPIYHYGFHHRECAGHIPRVGKA